MTAFQVDQRFKTFFPTNRIFQLRMFLFWERGETESARFVVSFILWTRSQWRQALMKGLLTYCFLL